MVIGPLKVNEWRPGRSVPARSPLSVSTEYSQVRRRPPAGPSAQPIWYSPGSARPAGHRLVRRTDTADHRIIYACGAGGQLIWRESPERSITRVDRHPGSSPGHTSPSDPIAHRAAVGTRMRSPDCSPARSAMPAFQDGAEYRQDRRTLRRPGPGARAGPGFGQIADLARGHHTRSLPSASRTEMRSSGCPTEAVANSCSAKDRSRGRLAVDATISSPVTQLVPSPPVSLVLCHRSVAECPSHRSPALPRTQ